MNSVSSIRPLAGAGQKWQRVSVWDVVDVVQDAPSCGSPLSSVCPQHAADVAERLVSREQSGAQAAHSILVVTFCS